MGMTKALQERIFMSANLDCAETRFVCVRYGNVLASRGSVIPLFHEQIRNGGPVTITAPEMTRFLLSLNQAVDTVFDALCSANPGETYIPCVPSARVTDIADALIGERPLKTVITGIRPGEKLHESLVSEEESHRTVKRDQYYAILPILPELRKEGEQDEESSYLEREYTSADDLMTFSEVQDLLIKNSLLVEHQTEAESELLR
jgi:FlaA1/EpsC-like NDP-sugar epimerase